MVSRFDGSLRNSDSTQWRASSDAPAGHSSMLGGSDVTFVWMAASSARPLSSKGCPAVSSMYATIPSAHKSFGSPGSPVANTSGALKRPKPPLPTPHSTPIHARE